MNRAIRHTWLVSVAMFLTLLAALSLIQVAFASDLNNDSRNARQVIQDYGAPRGPITVDGTPIAESVESDPESPYEYQRVYHDAEVYSGITGFYSTFGGSASGIERAMDEYLTGRSDAQFFDRMTSLVTGETMEGAQVELTLDPELQHYAYDLLPDDMLGTIIVTDVTTGEVIVMASKPSYNTNLLATHDSEEFNENIGDLEDAENIDPYGFRAVNRPIPPGSTFKLIDTVAMLESGDYEPDTELENPNEIDLPQSENTLENFGLGNCHQRSEAEFTWIFAQSCNTPFATAAMEMGEDPILEVAERFRWNEPLAIPIHVTESRFPTGMADSELAYASIGQFDVTATPLQMNMTAAAIGNNGTMMRPQLVDTVRGSDLQILDAPEPEVLNEVMEPETAADITEMMVATTEEGTGWRADVSGYDVATKTGTAEIGDGSDMVNSWITGFAPADDPQYAVTVVYERTELSRGSQLSGEHFAAILQAVMAE
ncbi:penicillin-binding transpeptidase domain-containing protein [Nesterenkonia alba]|uniref:penicillin-binding transpeptidase domain-containing protein n=1 Tax=Nesterenkonia alba TaxID=515814 RepID=UPI0003B3D976|nr:penicillin-binding transpeptidase domain-containing protein [Nesterenkonia alba]